MKCPICGTNLPLAADRCPDCGYRPLRSDQPRPEAPVSCPGPYEPPNKTSRSKCCCCAAILIIPLLALLAGLIFGLASFVINEVSSEEFGYGFFEDFPAVEAPSDELPAEAGEGCFTIRNGEVTFLPEAWEGGTVLRVPETVAGQTVTALGPGCFAGCKDLTTIILPDTVRDIGPNAFDRCTALRGLLVPEGVKTIGSGAFGGCISLESLSISASVTVIASGCMDDCASLLYIFYNGPFESWNALYSDFVNPFTTAICTDGAYYHGAVD